MQIRVVHTTGFEYSGMAQASFNEVRLTPLSQPGQIVVHSRIDVDPSPWSYQYDDYWGSRVTAFELLDPHQTMTITSAATVQTERGPVGTPLNTWEELNEITDLQSEFLALPDRVEPAADLVDKAHEIVASTELPGMAARQICGYIHAEMTYTPGSSQVDTHANHAWSSRQGVCQDLAHVAIGALRAVGIPARYISGYLHPHQDPEIGKPVEGESHAWVEWWDDGWQGFDPTNDTPVGDRHVIVAAGRTYDDVKPLKGIFSGVGTSNMFIDVEVTRLA